MASSLSNQNNVKKCKFIIIGAGMAGISAANHLIQNGVTDFIVVEARKRIGGRIVSIKIDENKFELGANWIHGVLGNPMYEIAMAHNLINIINVPKPHKVVAATEDGKQVPFQVLQEIYEAYSCFVHRCEEYFLCQYLPPEGINSVGEHIMLESAMYLNNITDPDEKRLRALLFDCLLKRETCISGCSSMNEIDLLELGSYTELQGGNIVLPSGYSSILGPVSQPIPEDKLLREHPVACVKWRTHSPSPGADESNDSDDSDRTVIEEPLVPRAGSSDSLVDDSSCKLTDMKRNSKKKNMFKPTVEVTCENGAVFVGETVICTVPLGVLKEKYDTLFSPPLPQYKVEAIEKLLFGTVNKIFLVYERPFLNPDISEVMLLWNSNESNTEDLSKNWYKKIYSFSKVSETVLLGWVSGKEAEYLETLTSDEIASTCTTILRKFLKDPFVPKPKLCICTHWHKEPFTRGSYTAIAVGASQADIESLAQPLYASPQHKQPAVLFAGEHTHTSFYSTVHGAYLSGRTAATLLMAPDTDPHHMVIECDQTNDLSSWIQGISLD